MGLFEVLQNQVGWQYNVRTKTYSKGPEYQGPCPWCGDGGKGRKSDRFHVNPEHGETGTWWCRQCGRKGDGIKLVRELLNCNFKEACDLLNVEKLTTGRYQPPRDEAPHPAEHWEPEPLTYPPEAWQAKAAAMIDWAFNRLMHNEPIKAWLAERGIGEREVKYFRLGWVDQDIYRPRESWGLPKELRPDGRPKAIWIPRGLVIPCKIDQKWIRIRIRRPEGEPRYYLLPGSVQVPMVRGLKHRAFIVVESELDVVTLQQEALDLIGLIGLGSSHIKPDRGLHYVLKESAKILISLDNDKAGIKASKWWLEQYEQAELWPPLRGKDPGDAYKAGLDLRAWVAAGLPEGWTKEV